MRWRGLCRLLAAHVEHLDRLQLLRGRWPVEAGLTLFVLRICHRCLSPRPPNVPLLELNAPCAESRLGRCDFSSSLLRAPMRSSRVVRVQYDGTLCFRPLNGRAIAWSCSLIAT